MSNNVSKSSPLKTARIAGVLYLVIFIASPFAFLISKSSVLVSGDAAATVSNILSSESTFRLGIAIETIVFLVEIVLAAILFELLKPVNSIFSLAAAFSRLAEAIIQAINLLPSILILLLVGGAGYLTVFETDQLNSLVLLFLESYDYLILVWGFTFGLHLLVLGFLVFKSGYFPRILGILLILSSLGYFIESYGTFLAPQYADLYATIVLALGVLGELPFTIYLLWKGLNIEKWKERVVESA